MIMLMIMLFLFFFRASTVVKKSTVSLRRRTCSDLRMRVYLGGMLEARVPL